MVLDTYPPEGYELVERHGAMGWLARLIWPEREFLQMLAVRNDVVRRIVEVADPDEVIVFGSVARGRQHSKSDLDLLVVQSGVTDPHSVVRLIQANLYGTGRPVDIIVVPREDVHEARGGLWPSLAGILQDGKTLYRSGNGPRRDRWASELTKSLSRMSARAVPRQRRSVNGKP